MTRLWLLTCVLIAALCTGTRGAALQGDGGARQPQQDPVFRSGSEVVPVYVTVTDNTGRLVTTLTKDNFELRDEGKPQPITVFDNRPRAIRLIVLLDVSGSMSGNLPLLRAGTIELLKRLRADDGARIGTFGNDITISPTFTQEPRDLLAALPTTIESNAPTPLWRGIDTALKAFGPRGSERDVILVLSDGRDSDMFSFRGTFVSQGEVIDRARAADVMIYGVGMRSRATLSTLNLSAAMTADLPDPGLARVAEETGGGYTELRGDNLGAEFSRIADELHSQYLLGFDPPKRDGKAHDIEVKVDQRGLKARSRKSYVAPKG